MQVIENECPRCGGARDAEEKKSLLEWCHCNNSKPKFLKRVLYKGVESEQCQQIVDIARSGEARLVPVNGNQ